MNTALRKRLSDDQWQRLCDAVYARRKVVISETEGQRWWQERERFDRISRGDHWYRLEGQGFCKLGGKAVATIFDRVNETLGIIPSVRRFLVARVCKDLFGSDPWYYAQPQGVTTKDLTLKLQKHSQWKLDQADYVPVSKQAVGIALDLGECPLKTTWVKTVDISERMGTLLTHTQGPQSGQPVLTANGETIEDSDEMQGGDPATDDQGMPILGDNGQQQTNPISFTKAPEITFDPNQHAFKDHFIEEQEVIYDGLSVETCHWKDVNWPINAPSLDKADFVSHTYDLRLSALRAKYAPNSFKSPETAAAENPEAEDDEMDAPEPIIPGLDASTSVADENLAVDPDEADIIAILDTLKGDSQGPKSYEAKPTPHEAQVQGGEIDDPIIKVCEVSYDFDCFEDGILRRLWMVILPDHDQCIYGDFRANICPRAAKPIHLVVVNKVKHRAYGRGLYETYESMSNAADRLLNAILWKNSLNSDPVKIWNPNRTAEGKANPTLIIEPGRTYSIEGTAWGPKDVLQCLKIPDLDDRSWKLMELFMQLIQVDSGVTNANQGDMTDLPSNTTATGVNSMLESSSVLHQYILEEIRDSMTPQLGYAVELLYKCQDTNETFEYLEQDDAPGPDGQPVNDPSIMQVMELSDAKKLAKMPMQVRFLLTRAKRQEQREAAMAGIPLGVQYGTLPPPDKTRMQDAFVQLFRALGFDDPEKFFPLPDPNAPPPGPPPPKASEVVQIPFIALAPNQKDALAQQLGLPPGQSYPAGPTPPGAQPGAPSPVSSSAPSAPLPSNVTDDTGQQPDNKPFVDPTDAAAPQPTPPTQ